MHDNDDVMNRILNDCILCFSNSDMVKVTYSDSFGEKCRFLLQTSISIISLISTKFNNQYATDYCKMQPP